MSSPKFAVVPGAVVMDVLRGRHRDVIEIVERAYHLHGRRQTVNPPSYFLRFPDRPDARVIALPASVSGEVGVDGIKWISSFPGNIATGLPRASAVLILNDQDTGYPFACLESSIISAARTAASAALAADRLTRIRARPRTVAFIGTGLIARYTHEYLVGSGWEFDQVGVFDLVPDYADAFAARVRGAHPDTAVRAHVDIESAIRSADLVVFATTAASPHVHDPRWFAHNPIVLHVSLRDLAPEVLLSGVNIVDDVDHCLKAETSPHLTERLTGSRDFLAGTLHDVLVGSVVPPIDRPIFFSPFGLGVIDLAVGKFVHDAAVAAERAHGIDGFFAELARI